MENTEETKPVVERISVDDLESKDWCVIHKICDIIFSPGKYNDWSCNFARSILEFVNDWGFITRKQYNCVMNILSIEEWEARRATFSKTQPVTVTRRGYIDPMAKAMLMNIEGYLNEKHADHAFDEENICIGDTVDMLDGDFPISAYEHRAVQMFFNKDMR